MISSIFTLDNCCILTVDDKNTYYPRGRLIISDNRISALGSQDEIKITGKVINMNGRIVMPGLINTHTHSPASLFRGIADDLFLRDWLVNHMWPAEKNLTAELAYLGARVSYLEYLYNGMTTNVDMWYFSKSIAKAVQESGLRSVLAAGIFTFPSPESDNSLQDASDFLDEYVGREEDTLIYPCVGPHDAYSCSPEILKGAVKLAKKHKTMIHIHLSETASDNQEILEKYGVTPAQYMENANIFDCHVLAAHCIYLSDLDMDIFKKRNASISYNPVSNFKLCDGILPLKKLMQKGINVALGVDGAQSNNSLNMLSDIKTGILVQKIFENDPTFMNAEQAIRMITINGAKAINMDKDLGSLEVGKLADIISIDTNQVGMVPLNRSNVHNVYSHVVYANKCVSDVIVNGEILLRDGKPTIVNISDILSAGQNASDIILSKIKNI